MTLRPTLSLISSLRSGRTLNRDAMLVVSWQSANCTQFEPRLTLQTLRTDSRESASCASGNAKLLSFTMCTRDTYWQMFAPRDVDSNASTQNCVEPRIQSYLATSITVIPLYRTDWLILQPRATCIFFFRKPRSKFISCTDLLLFKERNKWEKGKHLLLLRQCVKESLVK